MTAWTDADWEERHCIWLAGFEAGQRVANARAARTLAQELLSAQAAEMGAWARREATRNHGPGWAALVCGEEVA